MTLVVPGDQREAHLALVLLLSRLAQAPSESVELTDLRADLARVLQETRVP